MTPRIVLLLLVLAAGATRADEAAAATDPVREKATELTREHDTRAARIVALHAFVRDEVVVIPTQWG